MCAPTCRRCRVLTSGIDLRHRPRPHCFAASKSEGIHHHALDRPEYAVTGITPDGPLAFTVLPVETRPDKPLLDKATDVHLPSMAGPLSGDVG